MGISSGLPFMLIGNTLGFWLADDGIKLATIGALSWVGMTYTVKFVWGAMVDRIRAPIIGRLGRRRSWMLISQVVAGGGLIGMGLVDPKNAARLAGGDGDRRGRRRGDAGHGDGRLADRDRRRRRRTRPAHRRLHVRLPASR